MNVLIGLPLLSFAGVQRSVLALGQGLGARWVVWQPLDDEGKRVRNEWFGDAGDRLVVYRAWGVRGPMTAVRLVRFLRRQPERVINLHYVTASSTSLLQVAAARAAGKRVVVSLHHPDDAATHGRGLRRRVNWALRLASAVVVTTPYLQEVVERWSPGASTVVIPLGLRVPEPKDRDAARASFGVAGRTFVVGFLARMWKGKGLPTVVRAVTELVREGRDVCLLAAGSGGPDVTELRAMVEGELGGRGEFLGFVPDHEQFFAALDVFAMPSDSEGFGLTFVEAAMQGVPSIGASVQGVPYVIDHGRTGYLIDVGDDATLARHLTALQDNRPLVRRLGDAARERAMREFTEANMAKLYSDLFDSLAL